MRRAAVVQGKVAARPRAADDRLDATAWVDAALAELATREISGVRIEILAKRLGVTKGSFYWHFRDRDALLAAMLERWRRRATMALIERLERDVILPGERLRRLLRVPMKGERAMFAANIELSVRLWGRVDERARLALEEVDELRLSYLRLLLIECGVSGEDAPPRAILAYCYMRVAGTLVGAEATALMAQCEDILTRR